MALPLALSRDLLPIYMFYLTVDTLACVSNVEFTIIQDEQVS